MRKLLAVLAVIVLTLAACAEDSEPEPSDGRTAAGASCEKDSLPLFEPGQLTIATSNPVFPPWFQGKVAGSDWSNPSPEAGEGFEGALAYEIAAQLQGQVNLWWFPIEGVQMRVGYDLLAFFNTIYSPYPVAFDFGVLDPPWENKAVRLLDGFNVGLCFIF